MLAAPAIGQADVVTPTAARTKVNRARIAVGLDVVVVLLGSGVGLPGGYP